MIDWYQVLVGAPVCGSSVRWFADRLAGVGASLGSLRRPTLTIAVKLVWQHGVVWHHRHEGGVRVACRLRQRPSLVATGQGEIEWWRGTCVEALLVCIGLGMSLVCVGTSCHVRWYS